MKRLFFLLVTLLTLCFNWTSCSDGGNETNGNNGNGNGTGGGNSSSITLSKNELEFDSNDGYQTIKITCNGEWEVTGGSDWCDISPTKGKTGEAISISVDANTTDKDRTVTYTFKCENQTAKLTVLQYGIIETSYVDLKIEEEGTSIEYNEQTGQTILEYKTGATPNAEIGQAFILSGEYDYDIRKITDITQSNGKLTLQTEQGTMCDLFKNVSFTLTTNPDMVATSRSAGRVITPTTIEIVKGDKRTVLFDKSALSSRDVYEAPIKIFDFKQDFSGMSLFMEEDEVSGELKWETWKANIGLDAVFHFDFGEKATNKTKIGELKNFKYYLQGNVDIDLLLALEATVEAFSFSVPEEKQTLKKDVLPMLTVRFMAGPVPVIITLETDLKREGEISCAGSIQTSAGFKFNANAKLGMEYDARTREANPITEFDSQFESYKPTYDIKAFLETTAGFYPHLQFHFYKFLGPYLDIKPLYTAKAQASLIDDKGTYIWDVEFGTKTTGEFGLELDWGLDEARLKFFEKELKKTTIFKAPASIKLESPEQGHQMEVGEEVEVCFHVQSLNYLTDELYDCPGALVNLKTAATDKEEEDGDRRSVSSEQVIASDSKGRVKFRWTPTKDNEYLIAELFQLDSETTEKAEFKPEIKDERRVLLEMIYQQTNGDNWTNRENWLTERPINEWSGVHIDEESGKIALNLRNNNLTGSINLDMTDESLKPLANVLKEINLSENQLTKIELLGHESLEWGDFNNNPINLLDITGCTALKELECQYNSMLTYLYAAACTSLEKIACNNNKLTTLFIEGCNALKELNCDSNELKELNISDFTELEKLSCHWNPIIKLSISNCNALSELNIGAIDETNPTLSILEISGCSSLKELDCSKNKISTLVIDECSNLQSLNCSFNQLKEINLTRYDELEYFYFGKNPIELINLSECAALRYIECQSTETSKLDLNIHSCNNLQEIIFDNYNNIPNFNIKISDCNTLQTINTSWNSSIENLNIDISNCPSLGFVKSFNSGLKSFNIMVMGKTAATMDIDCSENELSKLDMTNCTNLTSLGCFGNKLTSLNVSGCTNLKTLDCSNQQLTNLNVSGCTHLRNLNCHDNKLTKLDISGCTSLETLGCGGNQLTNLNVDDCTALRYLSCSNNKICSVIPNWFAQLWDFGHDQRYTDYWWEEIKDSEGTIIDKILHYTDNGVGWWYPGEPDKGYHGPN